MKFYYEIKTSIWYYRRPPRKVERVNDEVEAREQVGAPWPFDLRRWKEPPHLWLANMRNDLNALADFTRRYGVLLARKHPPEPSLPLSAPNSGSDVHYVKLSDAQRFQDYLRRAWRGDEKVLNQMFVDVRPNVCVLDGRAAIVVEDLWTLIRLMFLRDWSAGRARICPNPKCNGQPYLLAAHKRQKFCSHRCAVLISVHHHREEQRRALDLYRRVQKRKTRTARKVGKQRLKSVDVPMGRPREKGKV